VIREALVERGIDEDRIEINWFGGSDPIVPFSDLDGRWVNRRVEFYIVRPGD
jgi:outer membrane protein OmpA-like peptidoglycan-associated protein